MIDSRNGGSLVYSNVCGLMVYLYMIKRLGLIGNGKLWMVLLQRHLLGEKGTGANPTDRAKSGTKRSMVVDGKGVPLSCKRIPRYGARHWIVERTHSWKNRFRRLLIRWEKK